MIAGIEGMTVEELNTELQRGGRFVVFEYCVSILIMTFKRPSGIYFVRAGESAVMKGMPFTAISLFFGWWGFPWGPIYTIAWLVTNLGGGKDVTQAAIAAVNTASVQPKKTLSDWLEESN